jgi:hypothetical protein
MADADAYAAVKLLAEERPELLPLVRVILDLGDEGFNAGLAELERRGILTADQRPTMVPPG